MENLLSQARGKNLNILASYQGIMIDSQSKLFQFGQGTWYKSVSVY